MRLIALSSFIAGLVLTAPLRADPVYSFSPQGDSALPELEALLPDSADTLFPADPAISRAEQIAFSRDRWPCILKGALWSLKLEKSPPPAQAGHLIPRLKTVFSKEGVPAQLAWIAEVESTLVTNAVSKTGALGLFQFKPVAAKRFDLLKESADHRTEPDKSARAAAQYLSHLHSRLGDWPLAVAAYNAGEGCVERLLKKHGARTFQEIAIHLPAQTQVYVIKVMTTLTLRENIHLSALPAPR
jgi:hypothetical protein